MSRSVRCHRYGQGLVRDNLCSHVDLLTQGKLGACDGCLDELWGARVRRYEGDFTPSRQPFAPDAQTAALFHFDGSLNGLSGAEGAAIAVQ